MTIKVVLYGELKERADEIDTKTKSIGTSQLDADGINKISDILSRLNIKQDEVSHIFLNRDYSALEREVQDGDRVALFPRDMALLYKWYFSKKK